MDSGSSFPQSDRRSRWGRQSEKPSLLHNSFRRSTGSSMSTRTLPQRRYSSIPRSRTYKVESPWSSTNPPSMTGQNCTENSTTNPPDLIFPTDTVRTSKMKLHPSRH